MSCNSCDALPKVISAKKLNCVRISINLRAVHYFYENLLAKMTINNNSQFSSLSLRETLHKISKIINGTYRASRWLWQHIKWVTQNQLSCTKFRIPYCICLESLTSKFHSEIQKIVEFLKIIPFYYPSLIQLAHN